MNGHQQCRETIDRLQTFIDRELSDDDVVVIHFHLERCPPCGHLFRFEAQLRRLVKVSCSESAPPSLRAQILARMRSKT